MISKDLDFIKSIIMRETRMIGLNCSKCSKICQEEDVTNDCNRKGSMFQLSEELSEKIGIEILKKIKLKKKA